jgi:hypothetical protein
MRDRLAKFALVNCAINQLTPSGCCGGQHQEYANRDNRRDARIAAEGYRVLRFWNNQVFEETAAVLETIPGKLVALRPHPDLPASRGRNPVILQRVCATAP